mgnify:CR=1 FL=1
MQPEDRHALSRPPRYGLPLASEQGVQSRAHRESFVRVPDGCLEELRPGQHPMIAMGEFQHPDQSRYAHRAAADHCGREPQRLPRGVHESIRPGAGRCRLATVVGVHLTCERIVMQQKPPAAEPRGLRLDQREHGLRGDRRVARSGGSGSEEHRRLAIAEQVPVISCDSAFDPYGVTRLW